MKELPSRKRDRDRDRDRERGKRAGGRSTEKEKEQLRSRSEGTSAIPSTHPFRSVSFVWLVYYNPLFAEIGVGVAN